MNERSRRIPSAPVPTKAQLLSVKRLLQKKHRETERRFVIEGWKIVEEAANAGVRFEMILYDEARAGVAPLMKKLEQTSTAMYAVSPAVLRSVSDAVTPQGIVAVLPIPSANERTFADRRGRSRIVLLEGINDPGNVGTIVRTCDWFGMDGVVIDRNSADLYQPKTVRSSMGSIFHLPVIDRADPVAVVNALRASGHTIYSAELKGSIDVADVSFAERSVIVIGSESHGVSTALSALADHRIRIPRFGKAESLNAAMACGIILSRLAMGSEQAKKTSEGKGSR